MNFYIGNSVKDINLNNKNIEFSDELIEYILQFKGQSFI